MPTHAQNSQTISHTHTNTHRDRHTGKTYTHRQKYGNTHKHGRRHMHLAAQLRRLACTPETHTYAHTEGLFNIIYIMREQPQ